MWKVLKRRHIHSKLSHDCGDSPNVCEHVGILSPRLGEAKVAQLEHGGVAIVQQSVIQLQVPAGMLSLLRHWLIILLKTPTGGKLCVCAGQNSVPPGES